MFNLLNNPVIIANLRGIIIVFVIAWLISFSLVPLMKRLAFKIGAIDLPAAKRDKSDKTILTRIHKKTKPRLGGLAIAITFLILYFLVPDVSKLGNGVLFGIITITLLGLLDDKFELSGKYQLLAQLIAAIAVLWSGISIPESLNIVGINIDLNWFTSDIHILDRSFEFVFPVHILTLIWIVGITNIINWIGGIDGLNICVSSVLSFTVLLFALSSSNIPLAMLITIHLGANQGLLPYNWSPASIFPGSIGDLLNGFMLAIFALIGNAGWTTTMIILLLPISDAIIVILLRIKQNKDVIKNPLKLLSISDANHLHHRLIQLGYSRKTVLGLEVTMTALICLIALTVGLNKDQNSNQIILAFFATLTFIITIFSIIILMQNRPIKA